MIESAIKIYQTDDGQTKIDVKYDNETVWLTQKQMALLFDKDSDTIGLHLKNIYQSGELEEFSTTEESSAVQQEGKRQVPLAHWDIQTLAIAVTDLQSTLITMNL